jgi:prevent-host-death family protein
MNHEPRKWSLQEAKAKFSELVRKAQTEGPQIVTVHGQPSARITGIAPETAVPPSIDDMLRAFQACPYPEFFDQFESGRVREPVHLREAEIDFE